MNIRLTLLVATGAMVATLGAIKDSSKPTQPLDYKKTITSFFILNVINDSDTNLMLMDLNGKAIKKIPAHTTIAADKRLFDEQRPESLIYTQIPGKTLRSGAGAEIIAISQDTSLTITGLTWQEQTDLGTLVTAAIDIKRWQDDEFVGIASWQHNFMHDEQRQDSYCINLHILQNNEGELILGPLSNIEIAIY